MSYSISVPPEGRAGVWPAFRRRLLWIAWLPTLLMLPFHLILPGFLRPSAARTLYFKLPIAGARFHWEFLDAEAFLAGELTLRIINRHRDQTLVIFRDGRIQPGWEMIGDSRRQGSFYFGFSTDQRFLTSGDDSLVITLTAKQDLRGRGPYSTGVLRAGTWQMTGTYSGLYGAWWKPTDYLILWGGDPPVAYMECWKGTWPIEITGEAGWRGSKPPDTDRHSWWRTLNRERGTNGDLCGSHI